MKISIVIVNWNAGKLLESCLASIEDYHDGLVEQIIVVDNDSADGSERAASSRKNVQLIKTGENSGFGKACNIGARACTGDILLFLNPDAALTQYALRRTVEHLISRPDVGVAGVQLKGFDGHVSRTCTLLPTPTKMVMHALGVDRLVPKAGFFMADWPHDRTRDVDHVIGAFYAIRRDLFEQLQGFDERFFVYLEDLDLSARVISTGHRISFLADTFALHVGGGTSAQVKARRLFYAIRSRLIYSHKHFGLFGFLAVTGATLLLEPWSRLLHAVLVRSWSNVKETLSAYRMLFGWLPRWAISGNTR